MLARMPLRIFREWIKYNEIDPIGNERADMRAALISTIIAQAHSGKRGKRYRVKDFMLKFGPTERQPVKQKSPDDLLAKVMAMTRRMGGEVIDKRGSGN